MKGNESFNILWSLLKGFRTCRVSFCHLAIFPIWSLYCKLETTESYQYGQLFVLKSFFDTDEHTLFNIMLALQSIIY